MDMTEIMQKMLILVLTVLIGFTANKQGFLNKEFSSRLSRFLLDVPVPAVLLASGMSDAIHFSPVELIQLFAVAAAVFLVSAIVSYFVPTIIGAEADERGVYRVLATFPNSIFMGYPMVSAFFGSSAIIYPAIFAIPFNVALFAAGPIMLGVKDKQRIVVKDVLNKGTVFSILAMVLILLPFQMPQIVRELCNSIGGITSPLALLIIGSNLADLSLRDSFKNSKLFLIAGFRLLILPVICFVILRTFISDTVVLGCATILAGLPSAATAVLVSQKYGGNENLASQGVVMTTVLSVITIPAIMYVLFR